MPRFPQHLDRHEGQLARPMQTYHWADLIVCSNDAELVAKTIDSALMEGGTAVLISPTYQRFGVSLLEEACLTVGLTCNAEETDETELMKQLNTDINHYSTFTITKPLAGHNGS
ncbi:hypothetical protein THAOC_03056 [Thalassiosira oceanica]|uniref:Uncharacterized protein n=1 Tax=Thalassiosira oceanica TaxID=159749 RepID=K0TCV3_THAOC|nr:hypothetical protein THAOC_03056 [Thalassiosira oceanica]|eukprot:EJK75230.1 hypothetical protein THAOC_03056 [Thalassiosira oceanica]